MKMLKLLQRVLSLFLVILLAYALLTNDAAILSSWLLIAIVLWIPLTLWTTNRSRLDRIRKRWSKRKDKLAQREK